MSRTGMTQEPATAVQVRMLWGVAKKAGMDSDLLHARCRAITGKEHISGLSKAEAARLIDAITGVNTTQCRGWRGEDDRPLDRAGQGQINVILGLARKLGWLEGGSKRRLNAFLRARWGVEQLDWLTPETAVKVTEALKAMARGGRGERKSKASG